MMGYGKVAAFAELGHFLYFNYLIDMIIKTMYYLAIHPYLLSKTKDSIAYKLVDNKKMFVKLTES